MSPVLSAFPFLTPDDRSQLGERARRRRFGPGEVIIREGETNRSLFILEGGRARVEKEHMGASVPVAHMQGGEIFGEISFLLGSTASASVIAAGACDITAIDGSELDALAAADPGFAGRLYRSLAVRLSERLRDRTDYLLPVMTEG